MKKRSHQKQRGAILVVSLLLLLVMTVLALAASQSTRMQERMAGNARDRDLAFQAGEAALRAAEARIDVDLANGAPPNLCAIMPDGCYADGATAPTSYVNQTTTWWSSNAMSYQDTLQEVAGQPFFYTEQWADVTDTLTKGGSVKPSGTRYFVNTSRAVGGTDTAVVVVESTYAKSY